METVELEELLAHMRSLAPIQEALKRLRAELSPSLYYHCAEHTDDVIRECLVFGLHDGLSYHELTLLSVAAAYHDIGFISKPSQNEEICAVMAVERLTHEASLGAKDIESIQQMILDTTLRTTERGPKQIPTTALSRYLLDADVSNLGRTDFRAKVDLLRKETKPQSENEFYRNVLRVVDAHEWYTTAGKALRQKQKEANRAQFVGEFPDISA